MKYYVYLLVTKRKNKLISYVGYTNNLKKRILLHNSSRGEKFTRCNKWTLVYKKGYNNKTHSLKLRSNVPPKLAAKMPSPAVRIKSNDNLA